MLAVWFSPTEVLLSGADNLGAEGGALWIAHLEISKDA